MGMRCKKSMAGICLAAMLWGMAACGDAANGNDSVANSPKATVTVAATEEPTAAPTVTVAPTVTTAPEPTHEPAKIENEEIPLAYRAAKKDFAGTVEYITYTTKDYYGGGEEVIKPAYVYLPHGYDETKQYNVLFLMHSGGGDETEWNLDNPYSSTRVAMDNLVYYGDVEPFIIVAPNGRAGVNYKNKADQSQPFEEFGPELYYDLIPYIDANYATYADYTPEGYDISASRDHRAIAGFSFGGMQVINIGMSACLDAFSYFGPFAPATSSYQAAWVKEVWDEWEKEGKDYDIHMIYTICGTADAACTAAAERALLELPNLTDKVVLDENLIFQRVIGGHNMTVGKLGFYNFAQLIFK